MGPFKTVEAIVSENMTGPVTVHIDENCVESKDKYQFVDPVIRSICPLQGPRSGGSILNITGYNMNVGSRIEAFIDELPCRIIYNNTELVQCSTNMSDRQRNATLMMKVDNGKLRFNGSLYEYVEDPTIQSVESGIQFGQDMKYPKGTPAGGTNINVVGTNLQYIRHPLIYVVYEDKYYNSSCRVTSNITLECTAPSINDIKVRLTEEFPVQLEYGFIMDDVSSVKNLSSKLNNSYLLYPNPEYILGTIEIKQEKIESLIFKGQHLDLASQMSDIVVKIGNESCNITSISRKNITCKPSAEQLLSIMSDVGSDNNPDVTIIVGNNLEFHVKLSYSQPFGPTKYGDIHVISILLLFIIYIALLAAYRHSSTKNVRVRKIVQKQIDALESRVASECREAFAELQTEITNMAEDLTITGMPFMEYKRYAWMILFPNSKYHRVLQFEPKFKEQELRQFELLLLNKTFLLNFIRTLESNRNFSMSDRVKVASLIMLVLQSKMEYCTDILKTLLADLIKKCVQGKSNPKLLLRRTECVAEKMLSSWFTFLLYPFLRECVGEPLYLLFQAMKYQLNKGPEDAITGEARYSISEKTLIRGVIHFLPMTVYVSCGGYKRINVKVLDCDTISQVKEKSLDAIYQATPFSKRPRIDDLNIEWRTSKGDRIILNDFDTTTNVEEDWKRVNTLSHYNVPYGARLTLVPKATTTCEDTPIENNTDGNTLSLNIADSDSLPKEWHLVKRSDHEDPQKGKKYPIKGRRRNKMVSEAYLTQLMGKIGPLQKFFDDLFETVFSAVHRGCALPLAVKFMFDFLDDQALHHGITDEEIVHSWKSNALPLRFWVNLITNPNFVFDIYKSNIIDSCLSVVAQTLMESCSKSEHRLETTSKLLYTKDIPAYKDMVEKYYSHIKQMPKVSHGQLNVMHAKKFQLHNSVLKTDLIFFELYKYAFKYNDQIIEDLDKNSLSQKEGLAEKARECFGALANLPQSTIFPN
uniref:Plexin-A4 n=1 Tax=Cacopsylla melanoneura TaxID=428564 RepID=A0A8D8LSB8_9HEMI